MSDQNQSLPPTAKKRQLARADGRVAVSHQLTAAFVWLSASLGLLGLGGYGCALLTDLFTECWRASWVSDPTDGTFVDVLHSALVSGLQVAAPAAALCLIAAVIARFAQVGFVWAPRRIVPAAERLSPAARLPELFSAATVFNCCRCVCLLVAVVLLLGYGLFSQPDALAGILQASPFQIESFVRGQMSSWSLKLGLLLLFFAIVDYAYQRYRYEASLRMSPTELRAEIQAVEGNPQVTAGRRDLQRRFHQQ